jgi:hypothetical protein
MGVGGGVVRACAAVACVRALQAQRTTMNNEKNAVNLLNVCIVTGTRPFREQKTFSPESAASGNNLRQKPN